MSYCVDTFRLNIKKKEGKMYYTYWLQQKKIEEKNEEIQYFFDFGRVKAGLKLRGSQRF